MPTKYNHRRLTPREFSHLLRRAGMKINDFLFVTGRQSLAVGRFLSEAGLPSPYTPTMGDALILELAARDPDMLERMLAIANEYSEGGPPPEAYKPGNDRRSA